ncbi:MAG: hypothetical protein CL923_07500 [Deltaproteobacteria bacterium]|nr:hypothetical protein [Deltaproteobacteria bacterium]
MPKPLPLPTGNGCHAHVSVWSKDGKTNLMEDANGELGLSTLADHFIGELLCQAQAGRVEPLPPALLRVGTPERA